jgi:adenylate cyclase
MSDPLNSWLLAQGSQKISTARLVAALANRLVAEGLPIHRFNLSLLTRHPVVVGASYLWHAESDEIIEMYVNHGELQKPRYRENPLPRVFDHGETILRSMQGDPQNFEFPVMHDLLDEGFTTYLALPLPGSRGNTAALSLATRDAHGFSKKHQALLQEIAPLTGLLVELHETQRFARTLLNTYVGRRSGAQILDGSLRLGSGEHIKAALFFADVRDFSKLSTQHAPEDVIDMLNRFFETAASAIEERGGEILKFIGDAVLAIFPFKDEREKKDACLHALEAAEQVLRQMDKVRASPEQADARITIPIDAGVALHVGDVVWGNIGARRRLDFTVIGKEVNLVARLSGLCRPLNHRIIMSSSLAALVDKPVKSLGFHALKGFDEKVELFSVDGEN